jgi:hypothetical protein
MRRWRMTSAATAGAAAEERSAGWVCWRGNAEGLGGFTYVNRLSMVTLQATGMGFFGLIGSVAALSTIRAAPRRRRRRRRGRSSTPQRRSTDRRRSGSGAGTRPRCRRRPA